MKFYKYQPLFNKKATNKVASDCRQSETILFCMVIGCRHLKFSAIEIGYKSKNGCPHLATNVLELDAELLNDSLRISSFLKQKNPLVH